MPDPVEMLYLPETMANWPWGRQINPYYEEVKAQSNAWFHGFQAFGARSQHAFDKCDFGACAAICFSTVAACL
jgi:Delta6-protoilludene synthase